MKECRCLLLSEDEFKEVYNSLNNSFISNKNDYYFIETIHLDSKIYFLIEKKYIDDRTEKID